MFHQNVPSDPQQSARRAWFPWSGLRWNLMIIPKGIYFSRGYKHFVQVPTSLLSVAMHYIYINIP